MSVGGRGGLSVHECGRLAWAAEAWARGQSGGTAGGRNAPGRDVYCLRSAAHGAATHECRLSNAAMPAIVRIRRVCGDRITRPLTDLTAISIKT
eukprot:1965749-Prymnesium_polylepis.1